MGDCTVHGSAGVLDTYFPAPALGRATDEDVPADLASAQSRDELRLVQTEVRRVEIDLDAPPADTPDAYLRLHLLSHRLVAPRTINLDGIFGCLPNVVWTSAGPCAVEDFESVRFQLRARHGTVTVYGVDSSREWSTTCSRRGCGSPMPTGCGWAPSRPRHHRDARGLRQLQRGHPGHVDGRGSDLGRRGRRPRLRRWRRASIMGTLSGGGTEVISVGERCLLGTNAGIGTSLWCDGVVEAGLYVTAATKVTLPGGNVVKRNPVGVQRAALPPQLGDRGDRGPATRRPRGRAQRRPAPELTSL